MLMRSPRRWVFSPASTSIRLFRRCTCPKIVKGQNWHSAWGTLFSSNGALERSSNPTTATFSKTVRTLIAWSSPLRQTCLKSEGNTSSHQQVLTQTCTNTVHFSDQGVLKQFWTFCHPPCLSLIHKNILFGSVGRARILWGKSLS